MDNIKTHYFKQELKDRGWTEKLIKTFLGEPDEKKKHHSYKTYICLYSLERVQDIEKLESFLQEKEKADKRKVSAKKAVETKINNIRTLISNWKPEIKNCSLNKLKKLAVESYNDWNSYKEDFKFATINSDKIFLDRIMYNYIRHNLTDYEEILSEIYKKTGVHLAYSDIREVLDKEIINKFPYFKEYLGNKINE